VNSANFSCKHEDKVSVSRKILGKLSSVISKKCEKHIGQTIEDMGAITA
jgi:hypothetical protein